MVLSRLGSLIPPIYPCYVIRFDSKFDLAGSWLNGSSWHLQLKYMIRNCNSIMSETPILFADLSFGVQILFGCLTWHMPLSVRSTIWEDLLERFFTPRNNAEVVETERRWDRADLFGCIRSKSWEIIELMDDQGVCPTCSQEVTWRSRSTKAKSKCSSPTWCLRFRGFARTRCRSWIPAMNTWRLC